MVFARERALECKVVAGKSVSGLGAPRLIGQGAGLGAWPLLGIQESLMVNSIQLYTLQELHLLPTVIRTPYSFNRACAESNLVTGPD
jgi:hypothetical protein